MGKASCNADPSRTTAWFVICKPAGSNERSSDGDAQTRATRWGKTENHYNPNLTLNDIVRFFIWAPAMTTTGVWITTRNKNNRCLRILYDCCS